jgi:signal transduction histidine kinase
MGTVTILWLLAAGVSMALAAVCGTVWMMEQRAPASLMLFILGMAVAGAAYLELCMMHSATADEYGEWARWYHVPIFFAFVGQVLFVHYYLGTGRLWLLWTFVFARSVMLVVNFTVHPNFNFSNIVSLRHLSLLGEQVSTIGAAVPRAGWQEFAVASQVLLMAFIVDAAVRRLRMGGRESKRKALTISLGIAVPWFCTIGYTQLIIFGVVHAPVSSLPWFLGALLTMVYEVGRDFVMSKRAAVEVAELRNQLAQLERFSVLGQLTSSLTHELAQPLSANATNAATALKHLECEKPDLEELRAILADVHSDCRRGIELVARMRQLFKRRAIEMQPLRIEYVVRDVVALVGPEVASKQVALSLVMQPDLPLVFGDRVHLSQVLLNLVMNSIHAVQSRSHNDRRVVIEACADNGKREVEITVRDSGHGIPAGNVDKVFRPFFTTKPEGIGIGLTLSLIIVEAHGGRLWSDHMSGHDGAIFRFTLQRA